MTRTISLPKGHAAVVDAADYEYLMQWEWSLVGSGTVAGGFYARGTRYNSIGERCTISMHRAVLHAPEAEVIDHVNHDTLDNRRCNLREATKAQNMANRRVNTAKKSGLPKGVFFSNGRKDRYAAKVVKSGEVHWTGSFATVEEASAAYASKANELFGEFYCAV